MKEAWIDILCIVVATLIVLAILWAMWGCTPY